MRARNALVAAVGLLLSAAACPDSAAGKVTKKPAVAPLKKDLETPSYTSPFKRDADGWTVLEKVSTGDKKTQTIHVSSSMGDDTNDGLSPERPMRTLTAAREKLRLGYPDWLVLKRGDVFEESLWLNGAMGLSATQPIVITGYGEGPRPVVKTGTGSGFGLHPDHVHKHIALVGITFEAHYRIPKQPDFKKTTKGFNDNAGVNGTTHGEGLLVEDCEFRYFAEGIIVQDVSPRLLERVELRRNNIHHIWSEEMSQGIYTYNVKGLLIEENVIDQVGYLEAAGQGGTMFNHAMYLQNQGTGLERMGKPGVHTVVRGNLVTRSDGIQMRDGGLAEDNVLWRAWIALSCGGGNDSTVGGALCVLNNNVILDGGDISLLHKRGWGLWLRNLRAPSRVVGNIVANNEHGGQPQPLFVDADRKDDHGRQQTVAYLRLEKNVVYHYGSVLFTGDKKALKQVELVDNVFERADAEPVLVHADASQVSAMTGSGNRLFSGGEEGELVDLYGEELSASAYNARVGAELVTRGKTAFQDPTRSIAGYAAHLGLGSADALLAKAQAGRGTTEAKHRAPAIAAWIREGFAQTTTR